MIKKKQDKVNKSRIIYSVTDKGIDLIPVMLEIIKWSAQHDKKTGAPAEFVERVKKDKENLIKEITNKLKNQK